MKDPQPLVSVIAVCYNHSRFVVECLESIRSQTYGNTQLVIIDDSSKDDSAALIRAWIAEHGVRCVFIAHTENRGLCRTLNEALTHAEGKYVSIIATDDLWLPDKLEDQVKQIEQLPEDVGVLYGDAWRINEHGNLLQKTYMSSLNVCRPLTPPPEGNVLPQLLEICFVLSVTTLVRRSCFDRVGLYDETLGFEDMYMWPRIAEEYKFAFSPHISAKYRIVSTSLYNTLYNTVKWHKDIFAIYSRYVEFNDLEAQSLRTVKDFLDTSAEKLYESNYKGRNHYLWKTFRYDPRRRTLGMFLFSVCGASYQTFCDFDSLIANLRRGWLRHRA